MFRSVSDHFAILRHIKRCNSCVFGPECTISRYRSCDASILLWLSQNDFRECFRPLRWPSHLKRWKTDVLGLNALFQGSKVVKHPFYYIRPKMMFGSVSEHFAYLPHIKRCNSCVSGLNALFRGIEVAMRPFYSGWLKMIFGSVLDHFANLRT
jgi:hypothetical protein